MPALGRRMTWYIPKYLAKSKVPMHMKLMFNTSLWRGINIKALYYNQWQQLRNVLYMIKRATMRLAFVKPSRNKQRLKRRQQFTTNSNSNLLFLNPRLTNWSTDWLNHEPRHYSSNSRWQLFFTKIHSWPFAQYYRTLLPTVCV